MMTDLERELSNALRSAERKIRDLRQESERREEIWCSRLRAADARAETILRNTVDRFMNPPVIVVEKGALNLGKMSTAPEAITAIVDEAAQVEHSFIKTSKDIYFMDFLRSFWRRWSAR